MPEDLVESQGTEKQIIITPQLVNNLIKKLPNGKAPGPNKITTEKLKNLPKKTIAQIYYIFKACIQHSCFSKTWKIAKINSIPKSGKPKTEVQNCRPISLLSTLSKVLEKIIHIYLLRHLNKNNIIPQ